MASSTQPTAPSGEHDGSQANVVSGPLVETEEASPPPPPESVSLLKNGSVCSELSEDEPNHEETPHQEQGEGEHEPVSVGAGEGPNPAGEGNNDDDSTATANAPLAPSAEFVPPEFIYLTPDTCWPLEL
jgi:hypothetical protein